MKAHSEGRDNIMQAQIFEIRYRGGSPLGYLISSGAHDSHAGLPARSYELRQQRARLPDTSQRDSWFDPYGIDARDGHPVVGHVFFPANGKALDSRTDHKVLDAVIKWYRYQLSQGVKVRLEFIGHADARGSASFNRTLGEQRARTVKDHVDRGIRAGRDPFGLLNYRSTDASSGEDEATGDYSFDRRVDIVSVSETARTIVNFDETIFTARNTGPLTNKIEWRLWGAAQAGEVLNVDLIEIEIRNSNTLKTAFYTFTGLSAGVSVLPVSFTKPSDTYNSFDEPFGFIDVDELAGSGKLVSVTPAGVSAQCMFFDAPKLHHSKKVLVHEGIMICTSGATGIADGFPAASMTLYGRWTKMPYSTVQQRQAYYVDLEKDRENLADHGPKN